MAHEGEGQSGEEYRSPATVLPLFFPPSNDRVNYIYLSDFPSTSVIKYFVQSFTGDIAWVTESEQVFII